MIAENDISKIQNDITQRFNKNLAFFQTHIPAIYEKIEKNQRAAQLSLDPNTLELYTQRNGKAVYQPSPTAHANKEVEEFLNKMRQFDYRPKPSELLITHLVKNRPFMETLNLYASSFQNDEHKQPNYADIIVYGCGLGHHIKLLAEVPHFFHITIIEKDILNFIESMYCIDWDDLMKNLQSNKTISFIINDANENVERFHQHMQFHLQEQFPAITHSTIVYNHYNGDDYSKEKEIIKNLMNYSRVVYEKLGPDSQRILNVNENVRNQTKVINLNQTKITTKERKVVIVGAGPSVDSFIEIFKEKRDQFFLVSAGSSIRTLLKNGITPDIHFELEFKNLAKDLIQYTNEEYSTKDIILMATIESNPGIFQFFKDTYTTMPETSELQDAISREFVLSRGGVTCTNGATALITRLYQGDIYLVGLDFAHINGQHHSNDNITNMTNLPTELNRLEKKGTTLKKDAVFSVESVFGEQIKTTQNLLAARLLMETLAKYSDNRFINCSLGAKINGTEHMLIDDFKSSLLDKVIDEENLDIHATTFNQESIETRTNQLFKASFDVANQILNLVEKNKHENVGDFSMKIINIVKSITKEAKPYSGQYRNIMSICRLPLLLLFSASNYANEKTRLEIIELWIKEFASMIDYSKNEIMTRLENKEYLLEEDWVDK